MAFLRRQSINFRGSTDPQVGEWVPGGNPWILVGTLIGAKISTIIVIMALSWNTETGGIVALMNWHWLLTIAALLAGPLIFWIRLRRVRARRTALQRAEWMMDAPGRRIPVTPRPQPPTGPAGSPG
jgi:hypothetical protein